MNAIRSGLAKSCTTYSIVGITVSLYPHYGLTMGNLSPSFYPAQFGPGNSPLASTTYSVVDEYSQVQPSGTINLGSGESYSVPISLIAARN